MLLLYLALAFMAGIFLARPAWEGGLLGCATPAWLWLVPLGLLPFTPLLNRVRQSEAAKMRWPTSAGFVPAGSGTSWALWAALALCTLAGLLRYTSRPFMPCWTPGDLAYYNLPADRAFDRAAPKVTVEGYINSYPLVADVSQEITVAASAVIVDKIRHPIAGEVRLKTGIRERYRYGQPVLVTGRLVTPPVFDTFAYRDYLARQGVHSLLYSARVAPHDGPLAGSPLLRAVYAVRAQGEAFLNRTLPEPYAALANGMILGIEAAIPDELYDRFNATGSSHVIVISGSNVALIIALVLSVVGRILGTRRAMLPALAAIGLYTLLVGGDAAVMRAAVMGGLLVVATGLNRRATALVSLTAACAAMTLLNPLALWDVGLQLSSAATAGLILLVPRLTELFRRGLAAARSPAGVGPFLEEGLVVTMAANITTLPLVVYYFGRLSVVSLLTNLLIVPVQPVIMLGGTFGVVGGVAGLEWLGRLLLWMPWLALVWTIAVVNWTANLPGASLDVPGYGAAAMVITYLLVGGVMWRQRLHAAIHCVLGWLGTGLWARLITPGGAALLAMAALIVWIAIATLPDGRLHIWFLDVGQCDAILLETPSGRRVLVDGGASPQALFGELGAVMPFWARRIDAVVLTHPDGDHMNAQVELPLRFAIDYALETELSHTNPDADPWREAMTSHGATIRVQHTGGWVDLGDGVALWVLWPPAGGFQAEGADNENSLVLKVVYGDFSVLLTGDAGLPSEAAWVAAGLPVDARVLKVGHHGSAHSTSSALVTAVQPQIAAIQVGADNTFGHPTSEVLDNLRGRLVLRNDLHGRIEMFSDGRQMWVAQEMGGR